MAHVVSQSVSAERIRLSPVSGTVPTRLYPRFGKRLFDILFTLAILPFILPLIGLAALIVRGDGGPAFFGHDRVGRGGRTFRCWKIRTMVPDSAAQLARHLAAHPEKRRLWEEMQKLDDDPRVTAFGRFLRSSSLDELPQFLNVLAGDMSVVGPRPFLPEQEAAYRAAGGQAYYQLRPGLTGPWQVGSRNRARFIDRVTFDETYRQQIGLGLDLRLILATVPAVLRRSGR